MMDTPSRSTQSASPDSGRLLSSAYRRRFLILMFLVCTFNFADRAVFAAMAEAVKHDLKLTDFQIGLLQGFGFALLYAGAGIPIGLLAERSNRIRIIVWATAAWSVMTIACGYAGNFIQMLLARIGVGLGEAGFMPTVNSLASDLFPPHRRASALALILLGTGIGAGLGAMGGGVIAGHFGWRHAFLAMGVPGILVALTVYVLLREPERGLVDELDSNAATPTTFRLILTTIIRRPALRNILLGGGVAGFGAQAIGSFMAVYLMRVHGLPVGTAATLYGLISAATLTVGLLVGSFGTDWAGARDRRWSAWGPAIGLSLAPIFYIAAFQQATITGALIFLLLGGMSMLSFYGPTLGMIQNLVAPGMRATGAATFSVLYTVIGSGLGPTFIGLASDHFASTHFGGNAFFSQCPGGQAPAGSSDALVRSCLEAAARGLHTALMVSVLTLFLAAFMYLLASRTLRRDFAEVAAHSDS